MRSITSLVLAAVLTVVVAPSPHATAAPLPTPTTSAVAYLQDAAHSSASSDPIGADLSRLWERDLGGTVRHALAVDGRVFVTVSRSTGGRTQRYLLCLDARTGVELWPALALGGSSGLLAYGSGRLIVVAAGHVDAVDVTSGDVLWSRFQLLPYADVAPVVQEGQVFLPSPGGVVVLDVATGKTVATHGGSVQAHSVALTPTLEVRFQSGYNLAAVDRASGAQVWEYAAEAAAGPAIPVVGAGAAWISGAFGVQAVELSTGGRRLVLPGGQLAVAGTTAFLARADTTTSGVIRQGAGPIAAYDARSGRALWSKQMPALVTTPPLVTRDFLYTLLADGRLEVLDRLTGARRGGLALSAPSGTPDILSPRLAVAQGLLVVPNGRRLTVLGSSRTVWPAARTPAPARPLTAPVANTGVDTATTTHFAGGPSRSGAAAGSALRPPLARRWTRNLTATSSPLLTSTHAYVVTRAGTPARWSVRRLRLSDGTTSWGPIDVGPERMDLVLDGTTLVATGRSGRLLGLNTSTGAKRWELTVTAADVELIGTPATSPGRVFGFAASTDGRFAFAVSTADGKLLWSRNMFSFNATVGPAVAGSTVYYAAGGSTAYALSIADGSFRWQRNSDSSGDAGFPVLSGSRVVTSEHLGGGLVLDSQTGQPVSAQHGTSRPVVVGNVLYNVQADRLVAESLGRRTRHWSFGGDGSIDHAPTYANGHLLVSGASGRLWMLNATTGRVEWQFDTDRPRPQSSVSWLDLTDSPVVGGGGVLFPLPGQLAFFRPA